MSPYSLRIALVTASLGVAPDVLADPPDAAPQTILVKLDSNRSGTLLERRANRTHGWQLTLPIPSYVVAEQWEPACYAPCEVRLDANAMYSVGGGSAASSSTFGLPRGHDPLTLHVHAGSANAYTFGVVTTIVGVLGLISGAAVAAGGLSQADPEAAQNFRYSGLGLLASGAVATIVGIVLWTVNRTKVLTEDGHAL